MIYLDNAATSRFKPKCAIDALTFDVTHSANSGRSGHDDAVDKSVRIQKCRDYLLFATGAEEGYSLVFTKNCTEALNLAIFGLVKGGEKVVTSTNEHNSVLRPLFKLESENKIELEIIKADKSGHIDLKTVEEKAKDADIMVFGGACNVTGAICDIDTIAEICKKYRVTLVVDGAQSVPVIPINVGKSEISMLACPGHKGLHGVQGTGFLIVKNDIKLKPLLYGGTGTFSNDLLPACQMPESYEAGTQFSGGICALHQGTKWTFDNLPKIQKNTDRMSKSMIYALEHMNATVYGHDSATGVVCFNVGRADSGYVADKLNEYGVCVRSGIHCAPLVHKTLGTTFQGAVRASVGCDTSDNEISYFLSCVERIVRDVTK